LLRKEKHSPESLEVAVNHPLATLFDQFLKERVYLKNVTPATLRWYRIAFKSYRKAIPDDASPLPTKVTLQQFVIHLRDRGVRPVTCNTYVGGMNAFCAWLLSEGHVAERVKLPKLRIERRILQLLNDTQMQQLIDYKATSFGQRRVHLAALLILDTGLRVAEALNLRTHDVDYHNLILKVFGKSQKERLVPFSPELRKRLYRFEQFKAKKGIRSDFLFAGYGATRWEKRNSNTSLYLMQRKLGLPTFGWHRLRHTFATNYLRQGGDIGRSMVLGHTQITTTQRYLHLLTEDLSASHQRVSILNQLG
jgi:integrase/recombinase XerD